MSSIRKQSRQPSDSQSVDRAKQHLLDLSKVAIGFARVYRALRYPDGAKESDAEHSYHLALSATELAATYFPELNTGLVAQFVLVHDLPELYAGDTPSFNLTDEERQEKEQAEKEALERLLTELPPHTAQLLERYERQEEPEARFVRFVDKLMPILTVIIAENNNLLNSELEIKSIEHLHAIRAKETERLQQLFPEFPFIHAVREVLVPLIDGDPKDED